MNLLKGKKKGFTLIELLVVMAIIGILVGIGVPRFLTMTESSKVATLEANHRIYVTSISMYAADHNGNFPTAIGQLDKYLAGGVPLTMPVSATYSIEASTHILTSELIGLDPNNYTGSKKTLVFTP